MSKYIDAELLRKEILEHKEKTLSGFDRHNEIVQILAILDRQPDVGTNELRPTLPCKVGDTVWVIYDNYVTSALVLAFYIDGCGGMFDLKIRTNRETATGCEQVINKDYSFADFSKTVFLTPEAAKRALKAEAEEKEVAPVKIEDMGFSVRTYNCLKRAMINTLQDLSERTVEDLQCVRNLGVKSLNEIIDRCKEYGVDIIAKELENNE